MKKIKLILISMVVLSFVNIAYSQPTSPSQPEFTKFQPVGGENLVNTYNGAFNYNILLLTVPGEDGFDFPINMFYNSDVGYGEEASWVGYGWSLNPGAINRQKRGFPDDIKKQKVKYWTMTEPIICHTIEFTGGAEIMSLLSNDKSESLLNDQIALSANIALHFHSAVGPMLTYGIGMNIFSAMDFQYGMDTDGQLKGSITYSPFNIIKWDKTLGLTSTPEEINFAQYVGSIGIKSMTNLLNSKTNYAAHHLYSQYPVYSTAYYGIVSSGRFSVRLDAAPKVGVDLGLNYTYSNTMTLPYVFKNVYGYMYSEDGLNDELAIMDYFVEKDMGTIKNDLTLGVPFSNKDIFTVAGHGVSGTFSVHNGKVNKFRPNREYSRISNSGAGLSLNFIGSFGFGMNLNLSPKAKELEVGGWDEIGGNPYSSDNYINSNTFRFSGDMGGEVNFGADIAARASSPTYGNGYIPPAAFDNINSYGVVTSAKHIRYITVQDIIDDYQKFLKIYLNITGKNNSDLAYEDIMSFPNVAYYDKDVLFKHLSGGRALDIDTFPNAPFKDKDTTISLANQVAQFIITNEQGNKYVYGLPVYHRNEREITYGLRDFRTLAVENNKFIYGHILPSLINIGPIGPIRSVYGHEQNVPYAGSFLITSILSSDYVDLTFNGPTPDDLGSYVKFSYNRTAGSDIKYNKNAESWIDGVADTTFSTDWYQWRNPYSGFFYSKSNLTNIKDDKASFSSGERENYYLESIETKSHVAVFVTNMMSTTIGDKTFTGSQQVRQDAWDLGMREIDAGRNQNNSVAIVSNSSKIQKLEQIMLYKKHYTNTNSWTIADEEPVQTVCLDYDYITQAGGELQNTLDTNKGKLTLKKMWYEYGGTKEAYISPYLFDYTYDLKEDVFTNADYQFLKEGYTNLNETPEYKRMDIDAWGNYQEGSEEKQYNMITSIEQKPDSTFDPAAWKLKNITLPSGGEIKVQYEQDDYSSVHDRMAMVMVTPAHWFLNENFPKEHVFISKDYLTTELGLSEEEINQVCKSLDSLGSINEKIYFKVLCSMKENLQLDNCLSEYITGYATIESVEMLEENIIIQFASDPVSKGFKEFFRANKVQLKGYTECNFGEEVNSGLSHTFIKNQVEPLLDYFQFLSGIHDISCDPNLSYIRIPFPKAKKGGGTRVKRVLYADDFDKVHQADSTKLYGKEYVYKTEEGASSGVAANEPASNRNESPLIGYLKLREQNKGYDKFVNGKVRVDFEGLYGESVLPSANVGYSRVITKDIHNYKSCDGFTVENFYTYKDYPYDFISDGQKAFTKTDILTKSENTGPTWTFLGEKQKETHYLYQGYRYIITGFPGKPKSIMTYGGKYINPLLEKNDITSSTVYEYFEPGVPQQTSIDDEGVSDCKLGREVEYVENRSVIKEKITNFTASFDGDVIVTPLPFPIPSIAPYYTVKSNEVYKHVTTKTISYPAILKQITQYQDGIESVTKNLVFDKYSGEPIITETYDEYNEQSGWNGNIKVYSKPAHNIYTALGPKSINENILYSRSHIQYPMLRLNKSGKYIIESPMSWTYFCHINDHFVPGDILSLIENETDPAIGNTLGYVRVIDAKDNFIQVVPLFEEEYIHDNLVGLDSSTYVRMKVVRSGRANRLNEIVSKTALYSTEDWEWASIHFTRDTSGLPNTSEHDLIDTLNHRIFNMKVDTTGIAPETRFMFPGYSGTPFINNFGNTVDFSSTAPQCWLNIAKKYEGPIGNLDSMTVTIKVYDSNEQCGDDELDSSGIHFCEFMFGYKQHFDGTLDLDTAYVITSDNNLALHKSYYQRDKYISPDYTATWEHCYCSHCLNLENNNIGIDTLYDKVLSSSINVYSDSLGVARTASSVLLAPHDDYSLGNRGRWKPVESYIYNAKDEDNFGLQKEQGLYSKVAEFNWQNIDANKMISGVSNNHFIADSAGWLKTNHITQYNENSQPVEYQDLNGIYSAIQKYEAPQFNDLTKLVAVNAQFNKVAFESFEEDVLDDFIKDSISHSGLQACQLSSTFPYTVFQDYMFEANDKLLMNFWVARKDQEDIMPNTVSCTINSTSVPINPVVRVGDWTLCEIIFSPTLFGTYDIVFQSGILDSVLYVDDVRIQPYDAEMQCYVYDKNLRISAILNNQNLATFYQYSIRGDLIRNIAETSTGRRTTSEQHLNYNKIPRTVTEYGGLLPQINAPNLKSNIDNKYNRMKDAVNTEAGKEPGTNNINSKFDIFKFQLKDGKRETKILNIEQDKINRFFKTQKDSIETVLPGFDKSEEKEKNKKAGETDEPKK